MVLYLAGCVGRDNVRPVIPQVEWVRLPDDQTEDLELTTPTDSDKKFNLYLEKGQISEGLVHFVYIPDDPQNKVNSVSLPGDWNQWDPNDKKVQMVRLKNGSFSLKIELSPGVYHYKFNINGEWIELRNVPGRFYPTPHFECRGGWEDGNAIIIVAGTNR